MKKSISQFKREVRKEIASLRRGIRPFYREAGRITRDERKKDFEAGRGPDGVAWQGLAPETIRRKSQKHASQKIKRKGGISGLSSFAAKPSRTPSKPLMDQHVLLGLDMDATGKAVILRPWKARREVVTSGGKSIAGIHETAYKGRPARHHWGISKNAVPRIIAGWNALLADFIRGVK